MAKQLKSSDFEMALLTSVKRGVLTPNEAHLKHWNRNAGLVKRGELSVNSAVTNSYHFRGVAFEAAVGYL